MGLAVGAHQPGSVHAEHHVEPIQRHILQHHVVAPLQKAGIHGENRLQALLGHTARHRHRVALGDAHVKQPLGILLRKGGQTCAVWHGRRNGAHSLILPRQLRQRLAEHGGKAVTRRLQRIARSHVERADAVEFTGVLLCGAIALPLGGQHMEQHGPVQRLCQRQRLGQRRHIVAVHRPQIVKAQALKHGGGGVDGVFQCPFQAVAHLIDLLANRVAPQGLPVFLLEFVVFRLIPQILQMVGNAAHVGGDGHAVVVEHHDHGLPGRAGVVKALKAEAAAQRAVANQHQHMVILMAQRPGPGHAQRHGYGVGGVSGEKGVVNALVGLGKAAESAELPQRGKQLPPPGQRLVDVALMAHVEHKPVPGCVKHPVNGHRQLHHAQVGGQVPAGF